MQNIRGKRFRLVLGLLPGGALLACGLLSDMMLAKPSNGFGRLQLAVSGFGVVLMICGIVWAVRGRRDARGNQRKQRLRYAWLFKLITASVALFGSLALAEFLLERVAVEKPRIFTPARSIRLKEHWPRTDVIHRPSDDYLSNTEGLDAEDYRLRIDADGFIEPSLVHPEPDLEVFFLGGSTTECLYVREDRRFPYLVGRILEERLSVAVNSYNGGVSGNHSMHSNFVLMSKVLPRNPDIVVLMHCINDMQTLTYMRTYWSDHATRSVVVEPPTRRITVRRRSDPISGIKSLLSNTFPELYSRAHNLKERLTLSEEEEERQVDEWSHLRHETLEYDLNSIVNEFQRSLTVFCRVCRVNGIEPVLMTQANRIVPNPTPRMRRSFEEAVEGMGYTYDEFRENYRRFNEVVRAVATTEGVLLIDLDNTIPRDVSHLYDSIHFTESGSELVAEIVTSELIAHLESIDNWPGIER